MAIKGWRIIWIVTCLFQPLANHFDIALGMRREHHSRCVHGQSVPSPVRIWHKKPPPIPPPSRSPYHTVSPSWPLQRALPLLNNLLPPDPPCASAAPSSTPAPWKRQVRARAEYSHLREPFGKVLQPRVSVLEYTALFALGIVCILVPHSFIRNWFTNSSSVSRLRQKRQGCWYLYHHCFVSLPFFPSSSILSLFLCLWANNRLRKILRCKVFFFSTHTHTHTTQPAIQRNSLSP